MADLTAKPDFEACFALVFVSWSLFEHLSMAHGGLDGFGTMLQQLPTLGGVDFVWICFNGFLHSKSPVFTTGRIFALLVPCIEESQIQKCYNPTYRGPHVPPLITGFLGPPCINHILSGQARSPQITKNASIIDHWE